jgi:WD40 repeat protein
MEITSTNNSNQTNVLLKIKDGHNNFETTINKNILCSSCVFFEKLLNDDFMEKKLNKIKINVPNSLISSDIILSFTGKEINKNKLKNWYYLLNYIICCDYFVINYDLSILLNIKIPEEGFELLLEVGKILNYNKEIMEYILDNFPIDYDINKLSHELKIKICEKNTYYLIFGMEFSWIYDHIPYDENINITRGSGNFYGGNVKIYDLHNGNYINMICRNIGQICNICFSRDYKLLFVATNFGDIYILDTRNMKIINKWRAHDELVCRIKLCITDDNKKLISASEKYIKIWDIDVPPAINTPKIFTRYLGGIKIDDNEITNIYLINNNKCIISSRNEYRNSKHSISLFDIKSNTIKYLVHINHNFPFIIMTDGFIVTCNDKYNIIIIDVFTGKIIHTIILKIKIIKDKYIEIFKLLTSPNNEHIIIRDYNGTIYILKKNDKLPSIRPLSELTWDPEESKDSPNSWSLIHTLESGKYIRFKMCISRNNILMIIGAENNIELWNIITGKFIGSFKTHLSEIYITNEEHIRDVHVSPDYEYVAITYFDFFVEIRKIDTAELISVFHDQYEIITNICFLPKHYDIIEKIITARTNKKIHDLGDNMIFF